MKKLFVLFLLLGLSVCGYAETLTFDQINVRRDNQLIYKKGEDKPFTGDIKITENDGTTSGHVVNGKRNGKWTTVMPKKNVKVIAEFKDNMLNGTFEIREYKTNKVAVRNTFKNNKLNGVCREYYENGNVRKEGTFSNGQPTGSMKEFHKNGKLAYVATPNFKTKTVEVKKYDENGKYVGTKSFPMGKSGATAKKSTSTKKSSTSKKSTSTKKASTSKK